MYLRGLYAYPAVPGKTTTVAPDLATALPAVTNGGKTYTVTIRSGAMWNTSPARQVTGADAVLGLKRSCNPTPTSFGGRPDFANLIVGYSTFCAGFAKVSPDVGVGDQEPTSTTHNISGVTGERQHGHLQPDPARVVLRRPADPAGVQPGPGREPELPAGQRRVGDASVSPTGPYEIKSYVPAQVDPVRPQPGLERLDGPDPQGVRERDQRDRDRQPDHDPADPADQHGRGRHGVERVPAGRVAAGSHRPDEGRAARTSTWARRSARTRTSTSTRCRRTTAGRWARSRCGRR